MIQFYSISQDRTGSCINLILNTNTKPSILLKAFLQLLERLSNLASSLQSVCLEQCSSYMITQFLQKHFDWYIRSIIYHIKHSPCLPLSISKWSYCTFLCFYFVPRITVNTVVCSKRSNTPAQNHSIKLDKLCSYFRKYNIDIAMQCYISLISLNEAIHVTIKFIWHFQMPGRDQAFAVDLKKCYTLSIHHILHYLSNTASHRLYYTWGKRFLHCEGLLSISRGITMWQLSYITASRPIGWDVWRSVFQNTEFWSRMRALHWYPFHC